MSMLLHAPADDLAVQHVEGVNSVVVPFLMCRASWCCIGFFIGRPG